MRIALLAAMLVAALPARAMFGFQAPDTYFHGWDATWAGQQILVKDANGDGLDDVLLTTTAEPVPFTRQIQLLVLLQDPVTHQLTAPNEYPITPVEWNTGNVSTILQGDVNNDGVDDIIVGHLDGVTVLDPAHSYSIVSVIDDREHYLFPKFASAGDIDGDGNLDIAVLTLNTEASVSRLMVYRGDGAGHFDGGSELALPGTTCCFVDLRVEDLNSDGKQDVVLSLNLTQPPYDGQFGLWAYYNNGGGAFGSAPKFLAQGGGTDGMAVGDIDGDGTPDLATAYIDPKSGGPAIPVMRVYLHGKVGTPYRQFRQWASNSGGADVIRDLNGDGKQDLLYRDGGYSDPESGLGVCLETYVPSGGKLAYRYPLACYMGLAANTVATGDINGDGLMDIVHGDAKGGVGWALGTNSPDIKNVVIGEGLSPGAVAFNIKNASTTASIIEPQVEITLSVNRGSFDIIDWPAQCSRKYQPFQNTIVCNYPDLAAAQNATGIVHYTVLQSQPYMQLHATAKVTTPTVETIPSDNTATAATWIRQL